MPRRRPAAARGPLTRRSTPTSGTTGATCRSSPSTPPGRATSTRPSRSSSSATGGGLAGLVRHRRRRRLRRPAAPVDVEARRRGVTLYLPDGRAPLHPTALSEGAASLLPDVDRPALLWRLEVDCDGRAHLGPGPAGGGAQPGPARLPVGAGGARRRSRSATTTRSCCSGRCGLDLVAAEEAARGGVSLPAARAGRRAATSAGEYASRGGSPLAVERWNAQLSLLCGRAAANLMLQGGVRRCCGRCRPSTTRCGDAGCGAGRGALGVTWPDGPSTGPTRRSCAVLDPDSAVGAALLNSAARALRGAGYVAFGPGVGPAPEGEAAPPQRRGRAIRPRHRAAAAARRPVRRRGRPRRVATHVDAPEWVLEALGGAAAAPGAGQPARGAQVSRAVVDLAEAVVLLEPGRRRASTPWWWATDERGSAPPGARPAGAGPVQGGSRARRGAAGHAWCRRTRWPAGWSWCRPE